MTTEERCAFCERPATTEAEIVPKLKFYPEGENDLKRLAVMAPVCEHHAETVARERGWQHRLYEARQARQVALEDAAAAAQLFDPDALDTRRSGGRRTSPRSASRQHR